MGAVADQIIRKIGKKRGVSPETAALVGRMVSHAASGAAKATSDYKNPEEAEEAWNRHVDEAFQKAKAGKIPSNGVLLVKFTNVDGYHAVETDSEGNIKTDENGWPITSCPLAQDRLEAEIRLQNERGDNAQDIQATLHDLSIVLKGGWGACPVCLSGKTEEVSSGKEPVWSERVGQWPEVKNAFRATIPHAVKAFTPVQSNPSYRDHQTLLNLIGRDKLTDPSDLKQVAKDLTPQIITDDTERAGQLPEKAFDTVVTLLLSEGLQESKGIGDDIVEILGKRVRNALKPEPERAALEPQEPRLIPYLIVAICAFIAYLLGEYADIAMWASVALMSTGLTTLTWIAIKFAVVDHFVSNELTQAYFTTIALALLSFALGVIIPNPLAGVPLLGFGALLLWLTVRPLGILPNVADFFTNMIDEHSVTDAMRDGINYVAATFLTSLVPLSILLFLQGDISQAPTQYVYRVMLIILGMGYAGVRGKAVVGDNVLGSLGEMIREEQKMYRTVIIGAGIILFLVVFFKRGLAEPTRIGLAAALTELWQLVTTDFMWVWPLVAISIAASITAYFTSWKRPLTIGTALVAAVLLIGGVTTQSMFLPDTDPTKAVQGLFSGENSKKDPTQKVTGQPPKRVNTRPQSDGMAEAKSRLCNMDDLPERDRKLANCPD